MSDLQKISDRPMRSMDMREQVNIIQEVMRDVMKADVHYGVIPGTKERSLYKAGAEKIMATFRLSADPEIEDLSTSDQIRYRIKVRLVSPSGVFVGSGVGECSSSEEKYKWRFAVCDEEFNETADERRRQKWKKGWNGKPNTRIKQVRTEPADQANTILKMAKKRALVDAVLTATAASDCFTQDIEDLPEEYVSRYDEDRPAPREPKALPEMDEERFNANLKQYQSLIENQTYTANALIATLKTKCVLTEAQISEIRKLEPIEQENNDGDS